MAGGYVKNYLPHFPQPEIRMMLMGFAAREALHIAAYSHLDGEEREIVHAEVYRNQEREDLILKIFGCSALLLIGLFFKLKQVCPIENLFNC